MTTRLLGLRAESYKRLDLVEIQFPADGGAFAVMGANEAGKSSTLDAVEATIAGRKATKASRPVKAGETSSKIVATFDDIVVTRTYKADGSTAIKVTAADGRRIDRAEDLLTRLYSHVALDPLAFSRLSEAEQVGTLLPMIGFDPAPLDQARREAYDLRTVKNREVSSLRARLDAMPAPFSGLPTEEVSVRDLSDRLQNVIAHNNARADAIRQAQQLNDFVKASEDALRQAVEKHDALVQEQKEAQKRAAEFPPAGDPDALRAAIADADATNARIRDSRERARVAADLKAAEAEAADYSQTIADLAAEKEAALAAAAERMPVPGLSIDDDGILTLDGIPFSQASTGVKIRTGTAVAMALNPDLRLIIIRDASLLDAGNREVIDSLAKANGFLVLMEIADESAEVGVVIEAGVVREVRS